MTLKSVSPRSRTMMMGSLLVATALMMPSADFSTNLHNAYRHRPVLVTMIDASQPDTPSAYDVEHGMTSSQLLNRWDAFISEASKRFDIPKAWIRAVMQRESGGRTMLDAEKPMVSRAGALGLMQVLPQTYSEMAAQHKLGADPFDARDNILAGAAYLRWLHKRYGFPAMFAAYNAGPGRLEDHLEHGHSLPAETRAYVGGITRVLKVAGAQTVRLTRPDGDPVRIQVAKVTGIRAAFRGEYAPGVKTVISIGRRKQGVREPVAIASNAIRAVGGLI